MRPPNDDPALLPLCAAVAEAYGARVKRTAVYGSPAPGNPRPDSGCDIAASRRGFAAWIVRWQSKPPRLVAWVEANIEETLPFYRLPRQHHEHLKSTTMLERRNEEIKRPAAVVRNFPNAEAV